MQTLIDTSSMLRDELLNRIKTDKGYSARAMARDVGLSASFFSQVLNKHRQLNEEKAYRIADALGWNEDKIGQFISVLRYERAKGPAAKARTLQELKQSSHDQDSAPSFYNLQFDFFTVMSHWEYFAILELTTIDGFSSDERWMARTLGLTQIEVKAIIARLMRLGMLSKIDGKICKGYDNYATQNGPGSDSIEVKKFHSQLMTKAKEALFQQSKERIEFRNLTVSLDPKRLPAIKEKIRAFDDEIMTFMEDGPRKEVYQFSMQLFPLFKE